MGSAFKFGVALSAACALCAVVAVADPIPTPAVAAPRPDDVAGCAPGQDAIECAQMQLFRTVRSFFDQDKVELVGGLSLIKTEKKSGRSLKEDADVLGVEHAGNAGDREAALEDFTVHSVMRFFRERTLHWNLKPVVTEVTETARSVVDSIPPQIKTKITSYIDEGRGMMKKNKKYLKQLMPLLIALKVKLSAFAVIAYVVIALIAKKALLASIISLFVSGFIFVKKLLSQHHHTPHHEVIESHQTHSAPSAYSASSSGWDSYGGGGGHDAHGSYSNNVAQTLAYGGQKPATR